jgi:hypothetical protein
VLKRFELGQYEFGHGKKCELQNHLNDFILKNTLDLDFLNGLSTTHFHLM